MTYKFHKQNVKNVLLEMKHLLHEMFFDPDHLHGNKYMQVRVQIKMHIYLQIWQ